MARIEACKDLKAELSSLFNSHSIDAKMNLPDYYLADIVVKYLETINTIKNCY